MNQVSWKRVGYICLVIIILGSLVAASCCNVSLAASSNCELCIIEVQTTGLSSATEEYVVIANNTAAPASLNGVSIRYITAGGTVNSKTITLSGSLAAHMASAFVGSGLQTANPGITSFPSGLALADDGGTLQIVKSNTIFDEINWGTITKAGFSGSVAPKHPAGSSIVRIQLDDGSFMDSGNNAMDFFVNNHACSGLAFNEIQPFTIDENGKDLTPALEILKATGASTDQDCSLLINGQKYSLSAGDLGQGGGLSNIQNVLDIQNNAVVVPLASDTGNDLQMLSLSYYGQVLQPLTTSGTKLTQPQLLTGQSYAKFSSGWKATYSPTIGGANKLATTLTAIQQPTAATSDECSSVVINELLPNPLGDDAGNEWLELRGLVDRPVSLALCAVFVNGSLYQFGADTFVNPGDLPVYKEFSNGETVRALNLKNSDTNTISFGRLNTNGNFEPLQAFQYKDAPEGQTWARFDDGWHWTSPTPGLDNSTPVSTTTALLPTEYAASAQVLTDQTVAPSVNQSALLQITELLPNPGAPQTDEEDEYVELYNPSDVAVDLTGYKLEAGSTFAYGYTIPSGSINPHEYKIFSSGNSSLTLANSAGQVRLLSPDSQVLSSTEPYKDAPENQAWAFIDGRWVWTASPTPAQPNAYLAPPLTAAASKNSKKASAKTAAKPKAAAAAKKATTKTTKKTTSGTGSDAQEEAPLHMPILVGVGASALLYTAYEYRQDFANTIHRIRRNRGLGRQARQTA